MNKHILFLANLFFSVVCYSATHLSQPMIQVRQPRLLVSASTAELTQLNGASQSSGSTSSPSSRSNTQTPIVTLRPTSVESIRTAANTPDFDSLRDQVKSKFFQYYDINDAVLGIPPYTEMVHVTDTLDFYRGILTDHPSFERINYKELLFLSDELHKFDARKRVWLGSMIVDKQYQDILEAEHQKREELKKVDRYLSVVLHGSQSRFEQRQQYLQEREKFFKQLLQRFNPVCPILQEIRRI
jgi:hypothetical protein